MEGTQHATKLLPYPGLKALNDLAVFKLNDLVHLQRSIWMDLAGRRWNGTFPASPTTFNCDALSLTLKLPVRLHRCVEVVQDKKYPPCTMLMPHQSYVTLA